MTISLYKNGLHSDALAFVAASSTRTETRSPSTAGAIARLVIQAPTANESVLLDTRLCLSCTGGRGRPLSQQSLDAGALGIKAPSLLTFLWFNLRSSLVRRFSCLRLFNARGKPLSSTQKHSSVRAWYALDVQTVASAHEAVEYALMEASAMGTETSDAAGDFVQVTGYFADTPNRELVRRELAEALRVYDLPSTSIRQMDLREVADEDWLGEWKKSWQPVGVGERFLIAPPWAEISDGTTGWHPH